MIIRPELQPIVPKQLHENHPGCRGDEKCGEEIYIFMVTRYWHIEKRAESSHAFFVRATNIAHHQPHCIPGSGQTDICMVFMWACRTIFWKDVVGAHSMCPEEYEMSNTTSQNTITILQCSTWSPTMIHNRFHRILQDEGKCISMQGKR